MSGLSFVPQEARPYQGTPAGVVTRSIAGAADILIVAVCVGAAYLGWVAVLFVVRPRDFTVPAVDTSLMISAGLAALVLYLGVSWGGAGRSGGKQLMGLRVVGRRGGRVSLPVALLRAVLCVAFPVGLLWVAVSARNGSLQDIVLGTAVVHDWAPPPR